MPLTTCAQAAKDSGITTRSGVRRQAPAVADPAPCAPKPKKQTRKKKSTNENAPAAVQDGSSSSVPKPDRTTSRNTSPLLPATEAPTEPLAEPTPLSHSSKTKALHIIRQYALTQEGEVNDITDQVHQLLQDHFTDERVTLAHTHDKAANSLCLAVEELAVLSPTAISSSSIPCGDSCPPRPISPVQEVPDGIESPEVFMGGEIQDEDSGGDIAAGELDKVIEGDTVGEDLTQVQSLGRGTEVTSYATRHGVEDSVIDSDSGEEDDYEETEREKRKKENSRRTRRGLSPLPPFGEDSEDEDDDDEEETDPPIRSRKRHYGNLKTNPKLKSKGKGKSRVDTPSMRPDEHNDKEDDEGTFSDPDEPPGKPGPIDAGVRAEAQRNYKEYEAKQRALALKAGKPLSAIFRAAGDSRKLLRNWNLWNLWQKWLVHVDGGQKEGESPTEGEDQNVWMKRRWEEKRREVLGEDWKDTKKVQDSFQWLIDWYEPLYQANALPIIQKGLTKRQIQSVAEDFNSYARHANRNVGLCCFGFIVDLHGEHSVMFGAGTEFEDMRGHSQTQLDQYLTDVVALVWVSNVNIRLHSNHGSDHQALVDYAAGVPLKANKDAHRKFLSFVLRYDLSQIDQSFNWKTGKFAWQTFANAAWKYCVRLVNWHKEVGVPGTTLQDLKTNVPIHILYEIGEARLIELKRHAKAYEEGKEEDEILEDIDDKALRIVPWDEEEKELAAEDQGKVPVVLSTEGKTLCRVKNSEKWVKAVNNDQPRRKGKAPVRKLKGNTNHLRSPSRSPSPADSRQSSPEPHSRSHSSSPGPSYHSSQRTPAQHHSRSHSNSPGPSRYPHVPMHGCSCRPSSQHRAHSHSRSSDSSCRSHVPARGCSPTRSIHAATRDAASRSQTSGSEELVWDETVGDQIRASCLPNTETPPPKYGIIKPNTGGRKRTTSTNAPSVQKKRRVEINGHASEDNRDRAHKHTGQREHRRDTDRSRQDKRQGKQTDNYRDRNRADGSRRREKEKERQ
ncbi:hypothetical protein VKT23_020345 [Stygiomarasmius scandens]|uniref:Uncharacterized protein n=1 Tax=Marasmiellus scandens TaxID=2682957 RepID=A0ABR1IJ76_9AGAR